MIDALLLLLIGISFTVWFLIMIVKWAFEDKIYEKYKFILAISIASVLSLLMAIVVEIETHWNPEVEGAGIGFLLFLLLVIGWFVIFVLLAAFVGVPSREEGEDGFSKFAVVLVPSILVSIVDVVIIWAVISSPWFPTVL